MTDFPGERNMEFILNSLRSEMDRQLEQHFYRVPIDRTFVPKLEAFLKEWERNFAPYVALKFNYQIDPVMQHLDISATIPQFTRYVVDFRRRSFLFEPLNPSKWGR